MRVSEAREERRRAKERARTEAEAKKAERKRERAADRDARRQRIAQRKTRERLWWRTVLPQRRTARRSNGAVSGLSASVLLLFVVSIVGVAAWAAAADISARVVSDAAGLAVVFGIAAVMLALALGRSLLSVFPILKRGADALEEATLPVGRALSRVDEFLVDRIAIVGGAAMWRAWQRYLILVLHLAAAGALGVLAPKPFGLIPLAWGFLVTLAIGRRWAWVEQDLTIAMQSSKFDRDANRDLQIGFEQDLRDEALLGLFFFLFFIPLGLAQINGGEAAGRFFEFGGPTAPGLLDWVAFFGAEMARAVPFVDWAEVYGVGRGASISVIDGSGGNHIVFAVRVLVDLLLLTALVQGLQVSNRLSIQSRQFENGTVALLDPFTERERFSRYATRFNPDLWEPGQDLDLPPYSTARLREILNPYDARRRQYVALAILVHHREDGWEGIVRERLDRLEPRAWQVREKAVSWLGKTRNEFALDKFEEVVAGSVTRPKDPRGEVRRTAIEEAGRIALLLGRSDLRYKLAFNILAAGLNDNGNRIVRLEAIGKMRELRGGRCVRELRKRRDRENSQSVINAIEAALADLAPAGEPGPEDGDEN